jgi:hypothetical protein
MSQDEPVTNESIDRLCALADLPLASERRARLVPMFSGLVAAANERSRKMAQPGHRAILPITRFTER